MGKPKVKKPHLTKTFIQQTLENKKDSLSLLEDNYLLLSFRHLDRTQGHSLNYWEEQKMLASAMETIANTCSSLMTDVFNSKKCTIYGGFPPKNKTSFTHPIHVPEDAKWARVHVTGKQCIIGHIVRNTFYIVFLDGDHDFWDASKK